MKKISLLLISGLLAANFTLPVWAKDFTDYGAPDMGHNQDKVKMETHKMTGTVDSIDYAKGTLTLKNSASDMMLHFPPASIKNLKNGDTITVNLGFIMGGSAK